MMGDTQPFSYFLASSWSGVLLGALTSWFSIVAVMVFLYRYKLGLLPRLRLAVGSGSLAVSLVAVVLISAAIMGVPVVSYLTATAVSLCVLIVIVLFGFLQTKSFVKEQCWFDVRLPLADSAVRTNRVLLMPSLAILYLIFFSLGSLTIAIAVMGMGRLLKGFSFYEAIPLILSVAVIVAFSSLLLSIIHVIRSITESPQPPDKKMKQIVSALGPILTLLRVLPKKSVSLADGG
jgi:hypothetical protein